MFLGGWGWELVFYFAVTTKLSRLTLCISCPSPRIRNLAKEPWFLLLADGVRNQDVGIFPLLIAPKDSWLSKAKIVAMNFMFIAHVKICDNEQRGELELYYCGSLFYT